MFHRQPKSRLRIIAIEICLFLWAGCACPTAQTPAPREATKLSTSIPTNPPTVEVVVPPASEPERAATATPVDSTRVIRIGTGITGTDLYPYHQIIHEFEKANPEVLIQIEPMAGTDYYSRLERLNAIGKMPDSITIADDRLLYFVRKGMLTPLVEFDASPYFPGLLEAGQVDGKQYLLPDDFSPLALYYNKTLFKNAGVGFPTDQWTWDDLLAAARRLTVDRNKDGKPEQWGIQMNASWEMGFEYWAAAAGGALISEDGRSFIGFMDSPETIRAARFYAGLYNTEKVAPPPADLYAWMGGNTEFADGKAAMVLNGYWSEAEYLANPNIDLGIAAPPRDKSRANILFWSGSGITAASQFPVETGEFLRYVHNPENSMIWKDWHLPVLKSVVNDEGYSTDPLYRIWYQELNYVKPRGSSRTPYWEKTAHPALISALETLINDPSADTAQVMHVAALHAQAALDEFLK